MITDTSPAHAATPWQTAIAKARAEEELSHADIVALLESDAQQTPELFEVADGIRRRYAGDWVHLLGVIEFSNICQNQCAYCGLRAGNRSLERYRMTCEEIVECAKAAEAMGLKSVVLQSAEDSWFTIERIEEVLKAIKQETKLAITLSVGEWSREDYGRMRRAGADRYLLKLETSDEDLFQAVHPDGGFNRRLECVEDLLAQDFQVGSGCMVGLPGQTTEMLANDILFFQTHEIDFIGIGPFVPNPKTPLGDQPAGSVDMTLKMMAVTRIVTKNAHIPTATALTTLDPQGREKAWQAGANEVMPILTPLAYRAFYQIYPERSLSHEEPQVSVEALGEQVASVGRWISPGSGESLKHPPYAQF